MWLTQQGLLNVPRSGTIAHWAAKVHWASKQLHQPYANTKIERGGTRRSVPDLKAYASVRRRSGA